jgi:hypothetical protein
MTGIESAQGLCWPAGVAGGLLDALGAKGWMGPVPVRSDPSGLSDSAFDSSIRFSAYSRSDHVFPDRIGSVFIIETLHDGTVLPFLEMR